MDFLSDGGRFGDERDPGRGSSRHRVGPELRPFDPCDDHDPDDRPPAGAAAAVLIRAPREVVPPRDGYSVYAVRVARRPDGFFLTDEDGDDVVDAGAGLTAAPLATLEQAEWRAQRAAGDPDSLPLADATHLIVNDGRGRTHARYPVAAAA